MKNTIPILLSIFGLSLFFFPHKGTAQCDAGQTTNTYCYASGLVNEVAFEFCPTAGMAAQSTITAGTFGIPPNTLTVYSGASGSGTSGTIVFGPATGDVSGNTIESLGADQCLIFVINSIAGVSITCADNFDTSLEVCSQSIAATPVTLTISPDEFCVTDGTQTLGGGLPTGGAYSGDGVTDDNNGTTFTFNPAAAGAGLTTVTYTNDGTATYDINVLASGTVSFTALADLCIDAGIQTGLGGGTPTGGTYSGPGVTDDGNGMTYSFNPAIAGLGNHTISYTEQGGCMETAMDDVEVLAACGCPEGQTNYFYCYDNLENNTVAFEVCPTAGMAAKATILSGILDAPNDDLSVYQGASGSGTSGTLLFGPGNGNLASTEIIGNLADNCLIFVINSDAAGSCQDGFVEGLAVCGESVPASVDFQEPGDFCLNDGMQTGLGGGTPTGGTYSENGVTDDNNGTTFSFDPAAAGVGIHTLTYTNGNSATVEIEVFQNGATTFTALADLCIDAGVQMNIGGGAPSGGSFSGPGVTDNGNGTYNFNPAIAGLGIHTISYTDATACAETVTDQVEVLAACGCPNGETSFFHCYGNDESDLVIFEVCPSAGEFAQATINSGSYGTGDELSVYEGASGSGTSGLAFGMFTGDLSANTFTASTPDNCIIFVSNSNFILSCQDGFETPLSVCGRSLANLVTFTALDDLSINAGVQTGLGGGFPIGGVYSGPGVTDDGNGMTYSFNPVSAGLGTHTLTYTIGGNAATDEVVVFNIIPPNFSKSFSPNQVGPGAVSVLTFTIDNTFSGTPAMDLAFTDNFPAGMTVAAVPNVTTTCTGGTITADAGTSSISLSGGAVGGNSSCTISVHVVSSTTGTNTNTTGDLTSDAGNSGAASANLEVFDGSDRPLFSKSFSPASINVGERSTLTFTIDNTVNPNQHFSMSFTDDLPSGMVVASPANISSTCNGGLVTALPGSNSISYAPTFPGDASVAANSSCQITVDIEGVSAGDLLNITDEFNSVRFTLVSSGIAVANLEVLPPPAIFIEKSFSPNPVRPGEITNLEFTITNLNRDFAATNVSFTDDLDAVLSGLVAVGTPLNDICGAGSQLTGTSLLTFTGGSIPAEGSCTFSIPVQVPVGAALGEYTNVTSAVTADINGAAITGNTTTEILYVENVPSITKTFLTDPIIAGGATTLEFTITNNSSTSDLTNVSFDDNVSAFINGTTITAVPAAGSCGAGSVFFTQLDNGSLLLSVINANVAASSSCTFSFDLNIPTSTPSGSYTNTTELVTGEVDGSFTQFGPATADLEVLALPRLTKTFTDDPVSPDETVNLEFTLSYDEFASVNATNITFTDNLDATLSGLVATGTPISACGGTLSGTSTLTFSGGSLTPGESCTFNVTLQVPASALPGTYTNTTSPLQATIDDQMGTGDVATDELSVGGINFTKEFIGNPALPGEIISLLFTLENDVSEDAAITFFTDNLAGVLQGMAIVGTPTQNTCGGTLAGNNTFIQYVGGTIPANSDCVIEVDLLIPQNAADGSYPNTTSDLFTTVSGQLATAPPASDVLVIDTDRLLISKSFTDDPAQPGGTVTLEYTITNLDQVNAISNIAFSDDFDSMLSGLAATGLPASECGGTVSGTGILGFSGGSLAAGASCTFSVTLSVPANAPMGGIFTSTTSDVDYDIGLVSLTANPASDDLLIQGLTFTKSIAGPANEGGTTIVTFSMTNNSTQAISDISFTDDLDAFITGATVVSLPASTASCGEASGVAGTSVITFGRGALEAGESCSFDVEISIPCGTTAGTYTNTTSAATYQIGAISSSTDPAIATVTVQPQAPTALCTNPTVNLTSDGTTTVDPSFYDGGSSAVCGSVSFAASLTEFDCDDVGNTYPVTLTVTAQESGLTATCTAMVTVADPNSFCCAPANAVCNNTTVQLNANGMGSIIPSDVGGGSTAECGLQSESVNPMSFDCNDIDNPVSVTYTITDINGASSSCTATVTVEDNIPPVPVCLTTTVELQPDGTYSLQEGDVYDANASTDNCSIEDVNFPATTYDCDDEDQTFTVPVTVTDAGGNTVSCNATITVVLGDALPNGWQSSDIGTVTLGNDYSFDPCATPNPEDGFFTITGSGNSAFPGTTDDAIAFAHQTLCGNDITITAKIESVTPNGYGGLMIRETTNPNSKQVAIFSNMSNSLRHETRYFAGANKVVQNFVKPSPIWLRLQRQGNWVFAFYSTNEAFFQYIHAVYIPLNDCIEIGLASFTYLPNTQTEATFSNVEITGGMMIPMIDAPEYIGSTASKKSPSLYPNPSSNIVNLVFEDGLTENATVLLRNQIGQVIEQRELVAGEFTTEWDVSTLVDGLYFFEIRRERADVQILRLVKTQ